MTLATIRREGGTDEVRTAITAALAVGTPADAARALGCTWSALRRAARRTGVTWPVPGEATATARAAALARYRDGRSYIREDIPALAKRAESAELGCEIACRREPTQAEADRLRPRADTNTKVKDAWERLFNERNRLWREEADRVGAVKLLLEANGCDCNCDHDAESHDAACDRCLACRISWAIET
jgi:hypothetical protein